jgi:membrane protease YdiL (CAAX protease family)
MNDNDSSEQIPPDAGAPEPALSLAKACSGLAEGDLASETWDSTEPNLPVAPAFPEMLSPTGDLPLFHSFSQPEPIAPKRIPHLGHLAFLALLTVAALLCVSGLTQLALHHHLFGVSTVEAALTDIHYTLGTMAILYLLTFLAGALLFPLFWHKSLLAGLQWNISSAFDHRQRLLATAGGCFVLAIVNGILLPGPNDTPIDKMFSTPGAAWLLFGFGVTIAPFFEEIAFRGFLLPALSTAFDWVADQVSGEFSPAEDERPGRNRGSMAIASFVLSIPFIALSPRPAGYYATRVLIVAIWSAGMALWWARVNSSTVTAGRHPRISLDLRAHPIWSLPAMVVASVLTSFPFALMHGEQTGWAIGPFLMLVGVSLVLCWVRLSTRSLAASVLVHTCYNFMLFTLMLLGTEGFQHLNKL